MITTAKLREVSFGTAAVVAVCVVVFALQLASLVSVSAHCVGAFDFRSSPAVALAQLQRPLTSNFLHGGVLHLLMNMMSTVALGAEFERRVGSTRFLFAVVQLSTLGGLLDMLLCTLLQPVPREWGLPVHACSIGLSGFLFTLMVDQASRLEPWRGVPLLCGSFNVPARAYPWVALFVFALIPGVSFVGHLSGVLVGECFIRGWLKRLEPSDALVDRVDALLRPRARNFVAKTLLPS